MEYKLDVAIEELDNAINLMDTNYVMEATSFAYKKHLDQLKAEFESDSGSYKNFYRNCQNFMDKKMVKEAIQLCIKHIKYIDKCLYEIAQLKSSDKAKEYFEAAGSMFLSVFLVGIPWVVKIMKTDKRMDVAYHTILRYKEKVENLQKELQTNGVTNKAYNILSDIQKK